MENFEEIYYIDSKDPLAEEKLTCRLSLLLTAFSMPPIYLCIGSDRVTGDALGPLVGTLLCQACPTLSVIGTLSSPVHALNLKATMDYLQQNYPDHPVVAIDASLGTRAHQEYFTIGAGSLEPGAGVNKLLGCAGDLYITGIVGPSGPLSQLTLQTVRLSLILSLAFTISTAITNAEKARLAPETKSLLPHPKSVSAGKEALPEYVTAKL